LQLNEIALTNCSSYHLSGFKVYISPCSWFVHLYFHVTEV